MILIISHIACFILGGITVIALSCVVASGEESRREEKDYTIIKCNENTILQQNTGSDCENGQ